MPENGNDNELSRDEQLTILRNAFRDQESAGGHDVDPDLQFIRDALPAYTIEQEIGSGGQGKVYSGFKRGNLRSVAIKVLLDGPFANRRQLKRFDREIDLVSNLRHPGIIEVYDSGTIQGRPYLVMEFVHGLKITDHAEADFFDVAQRIELFLLACGAVSAAHAKGIVHRDLKPGNIMVHADGGIRLLDFGLAKDLTHSAAGSSDLSLTEGRVGTAKYSSPEQIMGRPASVQSDVYSLGVVLFELLSTVLPYENTEMRGDVERTLYSDRLSLREAVEDNPFYTNVKPKDVSRNLEAVLDTAMAKEPDLRYATVDEFAQDLRRYLKGEEVKAQSAIGQRIRNRFSKAYRRKFAVAAGIAIVATSVAIAAFAWNRSQQVTRIAQSALYMASFVKQATAEYDARETEQAIATLQKAVGLAEFVPTDDPLVRRQAYQAYYNLAEYYFKTNRSHEALQYCESAIKLSESLHRRDPDNLEWRRLGSYSQRLSGLVASALGSWDDATRHFENMLAVREDLAEREPLVRHRKQEVGDAHTSIGKAARNNKQFDKAMQHDAAACSIFAGLMEAEPWKFDYVIRLSNAELRLSIDYMLYKTRDTDKTASEILARARKRLIDLNVEAPGLKNRIIDNLASIDANIRTLKGRADLDS